MIIRKYTINLNSENGLRIDKVLFGVYSVKDFKYLVDLNNKYCLKNYKKFGITKEESKLIFNDDMKGGNKE